jgi:hypothetical protein
MAPHRTDAQAPSAGVRVTERDRALLSFTAEHRFVRADHVRRFLGTSESTAARRLQLLRDAGYLRREFIFQGEPACHAITRAGLALVESTLPPPSRDVRAYRHDIGLAWLWLAARDGAFGPLRQAISERSLRSLDNPRRRSDPPLAVRLGGTGPNGGERLHYPDMLLITERGHRVAVELELSGKGRARREHILDGYAADPRVDAVLYLVESRAVGNAVLASARRRGIADLVRVERVEVGDIPHAREHARKHERVSSHGTRER